jgi:hypothetical protein
MPPPSHAQVAEISAFRRLARLMLMEEGKGLPCREKRYEEI